MSEKYLPLTSGRGGVRVWVGITQFKVSLDINLGALIQHLEVVVLGRVEGDNVVPGGAAFRAIAVGIRRWRGVIGCRDSVCDIFLVALGCANLWVFAQASNEDEFRNIVCTRRSTREGSTLYTEKSLSCGGQHCERNKWKV